MCDSTGARVSYPKYRYTRCIYYLQFWKSCLQSFVNKFAHNDGWDMVGDGKRVAISIYAGGHCAVRWTCSALYRVTKDVRDGIGKPRQEKKRKIDRSVCVCVFRCFSCSVVAWPDYSIYYCGTALYHIIYILYCQRLFGEQLLLLNNRKSTVCVFFFSKSILSRRCKRLFYVIAVVTSRSYRCRSSASSHLCGVRAWYDVYVGRPLLGRCGGGRTIYICGHPIHIRSCLWFR